MLSVKVVILGDLGVGKTCMRSQYVHHVFSSAYKATIGGDYLTSVVTVHRKLTSALELAVELPLATSRSSQLSNHSSQSSQSNTPNSLSVGLQIWDTAGQERFNSISLAFYRGTDVVVLVYDITNYESVVSLKTWFTRFMEHCHTRPGVVIVGNKADKAAERVVDLEEVREIVTLNNDPINEYIDWENNLFEISSKKLEMVSRVFYRVAELAVEEPSGRSIVEFDGIDLAREKQRRCC